MAEVEGTARGAASGSGPMPSPPGEGGELHEGSLADLYTHEARLQLIELFSPAFPDLDPSMPVAL